MTAVTVIDHLIYAAYRYQREMSPHIDPKRWSQQVFFDYDVPALEERYQRERAEDFLRRNPGDGPTCCDLASDGLACDCDDRLAEELDEAKLSDAQHEAKNADELDEYLNDLCNRRTPD